MSAFRLDGSGALTPHGQPIPLPSRPIHLTTDIPSEYVLVAFNNPSALRVYRINGDATLGEEVQQPGSIDAGIFAHQVRVTDNNRLAILVTRGNDRVGEKPEDPGALKVFHFRNGLLTNAVSVAQWRLRLRTAASRFPSEQAVGLRVARAREQDGHVHARRRYPVDGAAVQEGDPGSAQQYRVTAGGRHRARAPERPLRVRCQSRRHHDGVRRPRKSLSAAKTTSRPI